MAADLRIVNALVRFHTKAEILVFYRAALEAWKRRCTVGQIISQSMDGVSSSAALPDDPRDAIDCCEAAIASLDGTAVDSSSVGVDFRNERTSS